MNGHVALAAASGGVAAFVVAVVASPNPSDMFGAVVISSFVYLLWLVGWHSAIRIGPEGVIVDNLAVRHVVPWRDLAEIRVTSGLEFLLRNGDNIKSVMFGGSVVGHLLGYRYTNNVASRMRAARDKELAQASARAMPIWAGYHRQIHVSPWPPPTILAALEAAAVLGVALRLHASLSTLLRPGQLGSRIAVNGGSCNGGDVTDYCG